MSRRQKEDLPRPAGAVTSRCPRLAKVLWACRRAASWTSVRNRGSGAQAGGKGCRWKPKKALRLMEGDE